MMRGSRRLIVTAMAGLLAAGAIAATTASLEAANAATEVDYCLGTSSDNPAYTCTVMGTVASPSAITVAVTDDGTNVNEDVTVSVTTLSCTDNTGTASEPASSTTGMTPLTDNVLPLPATADGQCTVTATVSLAAAEPTGFTPSEFTATLSYTPASSASPTPTATATSPSSAPVHPVKGYDGKCVDDNRNSSANRAKVQIWTCSGTDQAQSWTYSHDELIHTGKCLNDQYAGGSGSHVILYTCNGASNEKWTELANGELRLQARGGTLCLDDPAYSTRNGTQLIVYTCKDSRNQRWSLP
jgi:Ricin-type beta-trefoil lectin domain